MRFYAYIYRDPSRLDAKGYPEAFYVGKGSNKRCFDHLRRKDKHPFVHRLQKMKKAGVEPIIEVIDALDEEHAFFLEICLISVYGRRIDDTGSLHNLSLGGEGSSGFRMSESAKQKISNASAGKMHTEECKAHIQLKMKGNVNCVGRKLSQETLDKMSATNKVRWQKRTQRGHSEETKTKMSNAHLSRWAIIKEAKALKEQTNGIQ